jgi:hypothetical protein
MAPNRPKIASQPSPNYAPGPGLSGDHVPGGAVRPENPVLLRQKLPVALYGPPATRR